MLVDGPLYLQEQVRCGIGYTRCTAGAAQTPRNTRRA
jgi:hypothetical protein